jgi:hypothetical protein
MVTIDKKELLRSFLTFEFILVVIPVVLFWLFAGALILVAGFNLRTLNVCCIFILFTIYFIPPGLIASGLFHSSIIGLQPEGLAGWLVVVCLYSVVAFLIALVLSLYAPSKE